MDKMNNKIINLLFISIFLWLLSLNHSLNKLSTNNINLLYKISAQNYLELSTKMLPRTNALIKPSYNAQGSLLIEPDGSAYIPVLFKDEQTLNKFKTEIQWNEEGFPKGYYDIRKIYILNKR